MRLSIPICFLLFLVSFCAAGQKSRDYKFVYRVHFDKPNDTAQFVTDTIKTDNNYPVAKGLIRNSQSKPMGSLTIILKSNDTTFTTTTNEDGMFSINIKPSNYILTIAGFGYKTIVSQIDVSENSSFLFHVTLARQTLMNWYNIHSSKKLSQTDINNIKNCVQNNEQSFDKCRKKYEYYLTVEI